MLEAKSMYLGVDIVSAPECDYQSYARLGLKCPFCDSAVFIRSASVRKIKGVEKPVGAYFAHFPSGYTDNWDCEARSQTKAGREEIERIKIEARGQRLKVYNAKLWQLIATDRNISRQFVAAVRKRTGSRWIDQWTKLVRREITQNLGDLYQTIDVAIGTLDKLTPALYANMLNKTDATAECQVQLDYFSDCDLRLHRAICYEVIEFLATNSGGWALNKLVVVSCSIMNMAVTTAGVSSALGAEQTTPYLSAMTITNFLVGTHWSEIIDKFAENNQ
jgi:hypothetical protein